MLECIDVRPANTPLALCVLHPAETTQVHLNHIPRGVIATKVDRFLLCATCNYPASSQVNVDRKAFIKTNSITTQYRVFAIIVQSLQAA